MKKILFFTLIILLTNCSFDNKTGIWESSSTAKKTVNRFESFKTLYIEEKLFNETIEPQKNLQIDFKPIKKNLAWHNKDYNNLNNLDNFSYKNSNEIIFKSNRLNKKKIIDENILFDSNKLILSNKLGDIIIYSITSKKIHMKYNFYKKKFKNIIKELNMTINNNVLYVSDNIGYIYAIDFKKKKLLWAKNFKIPFRSNIKVFSNIIMVADTNNVLYLINKSNGEQLRSIPTEENPLKSNFLNSIALNEQFLFFLNTYGSIYSTNYKGDIRWFLNVNKSSGLKTTNLFNSNPILVHENKIIISTDFNLFIMSAINGRLIYKISINSILQPIISKKHLFLITKNNLLVCINLSTGKIAYSIDIDDRIANFLETKKRSVEVKKLFISNNSLFLFLNSSYLVKISPNGRIKEIDKLPSKMKSLPIFINDSILYLNKKNKLIVLN